jgi:hypothetical protein
MLVKAIRLPLTHLEVETDTAHELPENDPDDESYVRLVITVETRVINVDMFNLNLA